MAIDSVIIDTNAYVAFKRGDSEAVEIVRHAESLAMNAVVVGELLSGFIGGGQEELNRRELAAFLALPGVNLLSIDHGTAERYATVFGALRRAGTPIPTNDMWIAASALQHGFAVFTYDQHFRAVEGLAVGQTQEELSS